MDRDPAHFLSSLSTTSTPKRLLWLACRGNTSRKREHYETHFHTAALGATWWTARKNVRRDTLGTFDQPLDLWRTVEDFCPVGRRVVLFAYDLPEQMRLAQMLTHLPRHGWTLQKIVLEHSAAWCELRKDRRTLMCCDLRSWTPVSWEKIVQDTEWSGREARELLAGPDHSRQSCAFRVAVIRAAVLQILDWIEGENLGQFKPTGSGQSLTAYRRRFIGHRLLVHDDDRRLADERRAMHTGRAEAWRHGRLSGGPFIEYDLHAAYATIGRDCDVPAVARGCLRNPSNARVAHVLKRFAVLADVTVTTNVECLPYKIGERTMWPVGTFRTLVWDPELLLALKYCDKVTVNHAWLYQRAPALHDFCAYVLAGMESANGSVSPIARRVLKHWSRCLVGRLGLRYRSWINFGPLDPPDVRLVSYWDLDEGTSTDMLYAGTTRLLLGDMTESRESLPQIPGWIMSECRARLWRAMLAVSWRSLAYCDTDSVIVDRVGAELLDRHDRAMAGESWVQKGTYNSLTIHGPRNIEVGSARRVAGVPLTAKQTAPLEFSGEVMRGVKHAMRNGELDLVATVPRTFHLHAMDLRRQHNPDGSTSPYRVEEKCL